jgi:hypothetical protein
MSEELQAAFEGPGFCWPERPDVVALARNPRTPTSGKITCRDELLCRSVMIDLISIRAGAKLSKRGIAARYHIGRETIDAIERVMDERGELRPLAEMVSVGLGDCIVLMMQTLRGALLRGEFSAAQIPIAMGVLVDKKAQLDAGLVPGTDRSVAEVEESHVRLAWEALRRARLAASSAVPTESESIEAGAQPPAGALTLEASAAVVPPVIPPAAGQQARGGPPPPPPPPGPPPPPPRPRGGPRPGAGTRARAKPAPARRGGGRARARPARW